MTRILLLSVLLISTTITVADDPVPISPTRREPWTTSAVRGSPDPPMPLRAARAFPRLSFKNPVVITNAPGTERLFVAEQSGKVYSFSPGDKEPIAELLVDANELVQQIIAREKEEVRLEAVYGLTFHPNFAKNRECYLCYVVAFKDATRGQMPNGSRVTRLKVSEADPPRAAVASEEVVLTWLQGGHNGGCLKFGPDGHLYISTGDGGNAYPPDSLNTGQNLSDLLSCILRIDVDQRSEGKAFSVPRDNPFVDRPDARGEIWSYGFRNPWKITFDRKTGELWAGDVGWELWELAFRVQKGANYGWSVMEGRQPVHAERERGPTPIVPPTIEIPHSDGASVTGGYVYRGTKFPELVGSYIFGDWETRRIWAAKVNGDKVEPYRDICAPTVRIVDFAEDNAGELYLLDYDDGTIHTFVRNENLGTPSKFPRKLSETGLFKSVAKHEVVEGVMPFSINAEQWSDGATAVRYLAVPGEATVRMHAQPTPVPGSMFARTLDFPPDTVLIKTLSLPDKSNTPRHIETQMLHYDGRDWRAYSYAWNDEQSDAELVPAEGREIVVARGDGEQRWRFEGRSACVRCHNPWSEHALAFNLPQINREREYGQSAANQIEALQLIGLLTDGDQQDLLKTSPAPPRPAAQLPRLAAPFGKQDQIDARARAYLHANCAHCHRNGGGGSAYLHLAYDVALGDLKAVGARPIQGSFGIANAQVLAPGDPYRSTLYLRMAKLGPGHMPHLGSREVDRAGLALIHNWIRELPSKVDDALPLDQLLALDEQRALAKEAAIAPRKTWELARNIAKEKKRSEPNADDRAEAPNSIAAEARQQAEQRMKERTRLAGEVVSTASRALRTIQAIDSKRFSPEVKELVIQAGSSHADSTIRDLFESYLPESQRIKRLGEAVKPDEIMRLPGDTARGKAIFHESAALQCRSCHKVGQEGINVGPDLSQIGKKLDRQKLLESILQPSKEVDPKFQTWVVETNSGKVVTGLLVKKDATAIVLKDARNQEMRIAAADQERSAPLPTSLMPELMLRDLTAQQAADLLSYLESLK